MLLGRAEPDEGTIAIPRDYRIGCLEQHLKFSKQTVLEEGCLGLPETEKNAQWKVAKARLAGMVQSRVKTLEKQKKLAELEKIQTLDFSFNAAPFPATQMMELQNLDFSYSGEPPYLINNLSLNIGKAERICIIGKNGKGKSTLLRLLAEELTPLNGRIAKHPKLQTGYPQ